MARYFEEYQEGEVFRSPGRTITETDVVSFSALSGDWNELTTPVSRDGFRRDHRQLKPPSFKFHGIDHRSRQIANQDGS